MKLHKTQKFSFRINVPMMIVIAAIVSSGCAALAGLGGGMALTEKGDKGNQDGTRGWQTQSNAQPDPNADAGYLYGVWKDDPSIP